MRGKPELVKLQDRQGNPKSDCWYIRYYANGRSQRLSTGYKIGTQDHEANLALAQFTLEREQPTARQPEQLLIAQALRDYYEEKAQFSATKTNAKHHEARLINFFGNRFVSQITRSIIEKYIRECRAEKRSDGTTRRELAQLTAALNHAQAEGRLTNVPKIKMPPAPPPRERVRPLPMNEEITELLAKLKAEAQTDYVLEYNGNHAGCVKRAFARACEKAGLENVSRYTLRHTYGTNLYMQGVHEKTIADLMGHTSAKTTSKHYLKTNMDILRNTVNSTGLTAQKVRNPFQEIIVNEPLTYGETGAAEVNRTPDPVITN